MAESPAGSTGRVFISYRRDETAYPAGWLYARLTNQYGGGQVFKDFDSIELGDDFVQVITRAVGSCDVLLALIGAQWLTITDEHGRRRLYEPGYDRHSSGSGSESHRGDPGPILALVLRAI